MIKLFLDILNDERGVLRNLPNDLAFKPQSMGLSTQGLVNLLVSQRDAQTRAENKKTERANRLEDAKELAKFKSSLGTGKDLSPNQLLALQDIQGLTPESAVAQGLGGLTRDLTLEEATKSPKFALALQDPTGATPLPVTFTDEAKLIREKASQIARKGGKLRKTITKNRELTGDVNIDKTGKIQDFTSDEESLIEEATAQFPDRTRDEIISALRSRKLIK